jgi:hypothetical protein
MANYIKIVAKKHINHYKNTGLYSIDVKSKKSILEKRQKSLFKLKKTLYLIN